MIGAVIVTHGQLATELVSAAEMIVGEIHHITAVSIGWHDDVEVAREEVERAVERVDSGNGVLLLTDMFGGTPTNIAASFLERASVEVVTGVSLNIALGETLGLVGQSGCGKSVTAYSILKLLPVPPARYAGGEIKLRGENLLALDERAMRNVRGNMISMIFQEPMTSLNPIM